MEIKTGNLSEEVICLKHYRGINCKWAYPEDKVKKAIEKLKNKFDDSTLSNGTQSIKAETPKQRLKQPLHFDLSL